MSQFRVVADRLADRIGGPRVLALLLLRALAMVAAVAWLLLAPLEYRGSGALAVALVLFLVYSLVVEAALWWRPAFTLRLSFYILLLDQGFALALIHLGGGARSDLYLALPVIAALQSYYYGTRRGLGVAVLSAAAYVAIVGPTIGGLDAANLVIRIIILFSAAVAAGVVAGVEERERRRVSTLTATARERDGYIRNVIESLREGVIGLDREGRITAWNPAMERWCGVSANDLAGRSLFDVNPNLEREAVAEPLQRLLRGEIISYGIVRDHQGTVDVRSTPGEGTTFVLTFRRARRGDLA